MSCRSRSINPIPPAPRAGSRVTGSEFSPRLSLLLAYWFVGCPFFMAKQNAFSEYRSELPTRGEKRQGAYRRVRSASTTEQEAPSFSMFLLRDLLLALFFWGSFIIRLSPRAGFCPSLW